MGVRSSVAHHLNGEHSYLPPHDRAAVDFLAQRCYRFAIPGKVPPCAGEAHSMSKVTKQQLEEILRRAALPEEDPGYLSAEMLAFWINGPIAGVPCGIEPLVDRLIARGFHRAHGVSEQVYRGCWPRVVVQPAQYFGRYPVILLVDGALPLGVLADLAGVQHEFSINACVDDVVPIVQHPVSGNPMMRYIAFAQDGYSSRQVSPQAWLARYDALEEAPLAVREGLCIPIFHPASLENRGIALVGSRFTSERRANKVAAERGEAPDAATRETKVKVERVARIAGGVKVGERPILNSMLMDSKYAGTGIGSRGVILIPALG